LSDILTQIIANKRIEVAAAKARKPLSRVEEEANAQPPARDFFASVSRTDGPRIIAECKRMSPSRGVMVQNYDPKALALAYERGGAAAISVLTDEKFFGGTLDHLTTVRDAVSLPVLRKDFIIDEYQIVEARAARADTFLLLSPSEIEALIAVGRRFGMEPLVESHTEAELDAALATSARVLGVNNRNLKNFAIDLETAKGLVARAHRKSPKPLMVCESGIKTQGDIELMRAVGYNVFLIGEALATHSDPQTGIQNLLSRH
jgi:indole-3-glycerol phosphate synthase